MKKKNQPAKTELETMSGDEIIAEIVEVLRESDGEFIAEIANKVLVGNFSYESDSQFTREIED